MPLLPVAGAPGRRERAQASLAAREVVQGGRVGVRVPCAEVGERRVCAEEGVVRE